MFTGLSAFPLTPITDDRVDEDAFVRLVGRLRDAGVDSIGALGSTGSYMYLNRQERARVACRTRCRGRGGGAGLIYDNPGTTHFTFSPELYARIAELPHVASVKIPGVPADLDGASAHVTGLRNLLPPALTIGVSGDASAATGLLAGCDAWYSVIGGTLPELAIELAAAARTGDAERAIALSAQLAPLWKLFGAHGSYRVVAAIAHIIGLTSAQNLPAPVHGLDAATRSEVEDALARIGVRA